MWFDIIILCLLHCDQHNHDILRHSNLNSSCEIEINFRNTYDRFGTHVSTVNFQLTILYFNGLIVEKLMKFLRLMRSGERKLREVSKSCPHPLDCCKCIFLLTYQILWFTSPQNHIKWKVLDKTKTIEGALPCALWMSPMDIFTLISIFDLARLNFQHW